MRFRSRRFPEKETTPDVWLLCTTASRFYDRALVGAREVEARQR